MNCPSCAGENSQSATFCQHCGARLANDEALEQAAIADADIPLPPAATDTRSKFQQAAHARQGDDTHDEEDVWSGSYSPKAMIGWWIGAGIATIIALVAGILYLPGNFGWLFLALILGWVVLVASYLSRRFGVHYYLTTQRFIHETGIFWRRTDRIELIDVDDVTFKQGPVQRLFNVGTIHLSSSDSTDPSLDLPGIEGVRDVADKIDNLRRTERRRRGLHIEAV